MKQLVVIASLVFLTIGLVKAQKPEKIYSIVKVEKPHEYYLKQAELWWKEIEKDKTNEDAWYNYFKANRYCSFNTDGDKKWTNESPYLKEQDEIIQLIEKTIPNTFTAFRVKEYGYPGEEDRFKSLEKAYQMRPDDAELYDAMLTYYEMKGNLAKRKEFNEKLFQSNEISSGIINYSYNVLLSLKPNGIILTFGDNDTYPLWLLQDVMSIRTDVTVLNVSLLSVPEYQTTIFNKIGMKSNGKIYKDGASSTSEKEIVDYIIQNNNFTQHPLYIGLPAYKQLKDYENNLYLVGLALEYSKNNQDNIAQLRNNFEKNYALDYISNRFEYDRSASIVDRMNVNYLPGIFKLYEHYTQSGDINGAMKMKNLGLKIAQQAGKDWMDKASSVLK